METTVIKIAVEIAGVWLKKKFQSLLIERRGKKILENFKTTVWKTERF